MISQSDELHGVRYFQLATFSLQVAILYFARDVLMPLALAILLSFILAPVVAWLERRRVTRAPAVLTITASTFALVFALGWVATAQITDLANNAPQYKDNLKAKIQSVKGSTDGIFGRLRKTAEEIQNEISFGALPPDVQPARKSAIEEKLPTTAPTDSANEPIRAEFVQPSMSPLMLLKDLVSPLLGPLGTLGIVIVLAIFILINKEDLRDRMIRLIGEGRVNQTTEALDETASKVGRFLLMQLLVNISYGIPIAVVLFILGIPNAALWGVLAIILRFVPYVGPWIAALMPIALSVAISIGWTQPVLVVALFLVLEIVSNNIVEPLLYRKGTGVSTVAILVAALFWTWIWGAVGLILSTPLTVCLVVMGQYIPHLEFLFVLLGDTPALEPKVRVYQRLLAQDQDEASGIIHELMRSNSFEWLLDTVLLPALQLSEEDRHLGRVSETKSQVVISGLQELLDEAQDSAKRQLLEATVTQVKADPEHMPDAKPFVGISVVCVPARDNADELAAQMLTALLVTLGAKAKALSVKTLAGELVELAGAEQNSVVVICALPPGAASAARYLLKRMAKAERPPMKAVVALWTTRGTKESVRESISDVLPFLLGTTFTETVEQIRQAASSGARAVIEHS